MSDSTPFQSSERERPRFPGLAADYGEDPARFLYCGTVTEDGDPLSEDRVGDSPPLALAITRIRGITDMEVLQAWIQVEEELGPRETVMAKLMQQKAMLQDQTETEESAEVAHVA